MKTLTFSPGVCEYGTGLSKRIIKLKDMDMNRISLNILVVVAVIIAICYAGRVDYNDAVLYNMDNGTYEALREKLGDVSRSELADAYQSNKEYWDSLGRNR